MTFPDQFFAEVERLLFGKQDVGLEEIEIWRAIIRYRDQFEEDVRRSEHAAAAKVATLGRAWASRRGGTAEAAEAFAGKLASAVHDDQLARAVEAKKYLRRLDASLKKRQGKKATPPRKLLEELQDIELRRTLDAVSLYLKAGTLAKKDGKPPDMETALYAHLRLAAVKSQRFELSDDTIDVLEKEARASWKGRSVGQRDVARFIVAKVAGLPLDTRRLR